MSLVESTLRALEQAVTTGRVGTLVAARIFVHALDDADDIPSLLARIIHVTTKWFGGRIELLHAHGSVSANQISTLVRLDKGQSLVVSVGTKQKSMPMVDVVLYGNRGVVTGGGHVAVWSKKDTQASWTLSDEERSIAQLVRHSQQTRQAAITESPGEAAPSSPIQSGASTFDIFRHEKRHPLQPPYGVLLVAGEYTHQTGYANALAADSRCKLIGVVDESGISPRRQELNEHLAQRLGLRLFPNLTEALNRPDVHAVSICAEPERRARIIVEAARAEKHLYLDKPLCATVGEAKEVAAAIRNARLLGHMFSNVHWDPATRVREAITSGQLGDIQAMHWDLTFAKGQAGTATLGEIRKEATQPRQFEFPDAKRELTNIGVYCVVAILWSLRRQVRRVFAATGNYFFAEHQNRDVEDFGQLLLELDGGITATVTAARSGWKSHPSGGINRVYLVGSKGCAVIDAYQPRAEIWSDAQPWPSPERDPDDPMAMWAALPDRTSGTTPKLDWATPTTPSWTTDASHFFDCLEQGRDPEVTVEIAAAATEVLLAGYRSAAERRVVTLPSE